MFDARRWIVLAMLAACSCEEHKPTQVTAEAVTNALEGAYGVHPGQRRYYTKGTCAVGTFVGEPSQYSRSRIFSGQRIPVIARFSLAGGDPNAPDTDPSSRGMALELRLPDGTRQHFTMINTPMFFAKTPRTFLDRNTALTPDPRTGRPNPNRLAEFVRTHPDILRHMRYLEAHGPPPSYTNATFYGVHTFHFIDRGERSTSVRFRFVPDDGERWLTREELATMPHDFLEKALFERLAKGPATWQMIVTVGKPGDTETDPTTLWPREREEYRAGTLTLESAMAQKGGVCEPINYDPLVMTDGIAPSADPVLLFRSPSYRASFERRSHGK
ncbi:MAG: catalase family peroxidase [Kofleriaceae bacterium]|nr:catalase family peroxidase [Kofleriaceae bacterium]